MVKVSVIGSGLLGIKIAGEFAYHGHRVKIYSNNLQSLDSVFERMEEDKRQLKADGILLHKTFVVENEEMLAKSGFFIFHCVFPNICYRQGQVLCMSRLEEAVSDSDYIFECINDDLEMKKDIFERISHICKPTAIISTNTLRLDVLDIVERTAGKERTLGLRFLFPVYYIPEVEITPTKHTSGQTIEKVRVMLEKMGKTLFFRSGKEPLILSEEQRDERRRGDHPNLNEIKWDDAKIARIEEIKISSGMGTYFENVIPSLTQKEALGHGPLPKSSIRSRTEEVDTDCAICMDKVRDCVMRPCHHMLTCYECAAMLINRRDGCPVCRKDIMEIIRVYTG